MEIWMFDCLMETVKTSNNSRGRGQSESRDDDGGNESLGRHVTIGGVVEEVEHGPQDNTKDRSVKVRKCKAACLNLCIALLKRKCKFEIYSLPLICAMAMPGLQPEGYKPPETSPPIMLCILRVARCLVSQSLLQKVDLDWRKKGMANEPNVLGKTEDLGNEFLIRGSHTAMNWLLDTRAIGTSIHFNTSREGYVD